MQQMRVKEETEERTKTLHVLFTAKRKGKKKKKTFYTSPFLIVSLKIILALKIHNHYQ